MKLSEATLSFCADGPSGLPIVAVRLSILGFAVVGCSSEGLVAEDAGSPPSKMAMPDASADAGERRDAATRDATEASATDLRCVATREVVFDENFSDLEIDFGRFTLGGQVAPAPGGGILAAVASRSTIDLEDAPDPVLSLVQIDEEGTLDSRFGDNGVRASLPGDGLGGVAFLDDGFAVVGSSTNADGSEDGFLRYIGWSGESQEWTLRPPIPSCAGGSSPYRFRPLQASRDRSGRWLVRGYGRGAHCRGSEGVVLRLSGARLDGRFSSDGTVRLPPFPEFLEWPTTVNDVAELPDGSLLLALSDGYGPSILKLTQGGDIDRTFAIDGRLHLGQPIDDGSFYSIAVDRDSFYAVGTAEIDGQYDILAIRAGHDGSLDTGFGSNGLVTLGGVWPGGRRGQDEALYATLDPPDGALLFGQFDRRVGQEMIVARVTSSGLDRSFGRDGMVLLGNGAGTYGAVTGFVDHCGGVVFAGMFVRSWPGRQIGMVGIVRRLRPWIRSTQ